MSASTVTGAPVSTADAEAKRLVELAGIGEVANSDAEPRWAFPAALRDVARPACDLHEICRMLPEMLPTGVARSLLNPLMSRKLLFLLVSPVGIEPTTY